MATSRKSIREWVSAKMGRRHEVTITIDGVDTTLFTAPELGDISADEERLIDACLVLPAAAGETFGEWRRITAVNTDVSPAQLYVNRAFDTAPSASTVAQIYSLLNPDQWNEAINEALTVLYFKDRETIPITTSEDSNGNTVTDSEYDLPGWIQYKGMLTGVKYRNRSTGYEENVPQYRIIEQITGLKLKLVGTVWSATTYDVIVEGHRYHSRLDDDNYGTTCPQALWQAAVHVAALHKVTNMYGARFKAQFAQDLAIAERELMKQRDAVLPRIQTQEYVDEEGWGGPDIDPFFSDGGWV